jgi:hypothetical protein
VTNSGDSQLGRAGTGQKNCDVDRIALACIFGAGGS